MATKKRSAKKPENKQGPKKPDGRKNNKLTPAMEAVKFQPGVSGNPGGRPKEIMAPAYRRALMKAIPNDKNGRTYADAIAEKNLSLMLSGDIRVTSEVTDRVDGKAAQSMSLTGPNGEGPVQLLHMTPEEKQLRLAHLLAKAAGKQDGKRGN